jgi:hypothetical protein
MSTFTDAFHEATQASNDYRFACQDAHASGEYVDQLAVALAQAGDVLEREMRQVVREEVQRSGRVSGVWGRVASQQMPFPGEP